jgi:hypothetical protein
MMHVHHSYIYIYVHKDFTNKYDAIIKQRQKVILEQSTVPYGTLGGRGVEQRQNRILKRDPLL